MFKKVLIVLLVCFLLGMATRAEAENAVKETSIESNTDLTGEWTQDEINYFRNKEYVGDERLYTEEDLVPPYIVGQATKEEELRYLRLLRNELFARSGYKFNSKDLDNFFRKMSWYTINPGEAKLNSLELKNVSVIKDKEEFQKVQSVTGKIQDSEGGYKEIILLEGRFYVFIENRRDNPGPKEFAMMMWEGEPEYPSGFAVSKDGKKLYLLDTFNERLQIFSSEDGKLLRSISVKTFEIANTTQIKESKKTWNPLGFAFPTIKADSLFLDISGNIIVVGNERVSSSLRGMQAYKPIYYKINNDDYSVTDLSKKIRALEKFPEESSGKILNLEEDKVKFSRNGEVFGIFLSKENDNRKVVIESNRGNIETDVEIFGKASVYLDKNSNFTVIDKQIDDTSIWNIKWNLSVYLISSVDGRILNELIAKADYYSSDLYLDEKGNIYFWERIPQGERAPYYESKGWRVVKLQGIR